MKRYLRGRANSRNAVKQIAFWRNKNGAGTQAKDDRDFALSQKWKEVVTAAHRGNFDEAMAHFAVLKRIALGPQRVNAWLDLPTFGKHPDYEMYLDEFGELARNNGRPHLHASLKKKIAEPQDPFAADKRRQKPALAWVRNFEAPSTMSAEDPNSYQDPMSLGARARELMAEAHDKVKGITRPTSSGADANNYKIVEASMRVADAIRFIKRAQLAAKNFVPVNANADTWQGHELSIKRLGITWEAVTKVANLLLQQGKRDEALTLLRDAGGLNKALIPTFQFTEGFVLTLRALEETTFRADHLEGARWSLRAVEHGDGDDALKADATRLLARLKILEGQHQVSKPFSTEGMTGTVRLAPTLEIAVP